MAMALKEARVKFEIDPKHHFFELEYHLDRMNFNAKEIKNSKMYLLVKKLTKMAYPSKKEKFDTYWYDFYFPMRKSGRLIAVPFSIVKYQENYWAHFFNAGSLVFKEGNDEVDKFYCDILDETLSLIPAIRNTRNKILKRIIPYDLRAGKIKGKYVLEKLMPKKEYDYILTRYREYEKMRKGIDAISLDDYLNTCAICYRAVYGEKTKEMTTLEMYWRWADKRHGGMLDIKDKKSAVEYTKWYEHGGWGGSHPFEIVFSWINHGIHLYPPSKDRPNYTLCVTNYGYAYDFINMLKALMENEVPFEARDLKEVLDFLIGDTYYTVNEYSDHHIYYYPCKEDRKQYFNEIEWEAIRTLKWKPTKKEIDEMKKECAIWQRAYIEDLIKFEEKHSQTINKVIHDRN